LRIRRPFSIRDIVAHRQRAHAMINFPIFCAYMREMNSRHRLCAPDKRKFRTQNLMLQAQLMSIQDRYEHTRASLRTTNAPALWIAFKRIPLVHRERYLPRNTRYGYLGINGSRVSCRARSYETGKISLQSISLLTISLENPRWLNSVETLGISEYLRPSKIA